MLESCDGCDGGWLRGREGKFRFEEKKKEKGTGEGVKESE